MPTEKEVRRAIKALEAAWRALEPLADGEEAENDSRVRLRSDMREYCEYLENAKWWRK